MPGVEFWDCRLKCILTYIEPATPAPGQGHWRLVRGEFEPEGYDYPWQAHGGVFIYYRALDVNGVPIGGQLVNTTNFNRPGTVFYQGTDIGNGFWATQPMEGQTSTFTNCVCTTSEIWPYTGWIDENNSPVGYIGPSDKVHGMGLTNPPYGTFCNAHVNYRLTFRWTPPSAPVISPSPTGFNRVAIKGEPPSADTLTITNIGGNPLHYTLTDNAGWLGQSPGSGTLDPQTQAPISVTYVSAALGTGVHDATITISDPSAVPPTVNVPVRLIIKGRYVGDFDGDDDVDVEDFGHLQTCISGPGVAQAGDDCIDTQLDTDVDVDQEDVNIFTNCLAGPGALPGSNCLNQLPG
jgi:hypothetical protein